MVGRAALHLALFFFRSECVIAHYTVYKYVMVCMEHGALDKLRTHPCFAFALSFSQITINPAKKVLQIMIDDDVGGGLQLQRDCAFQCTGFQLHSGQLMKSFYKANTTRGNL